MSDDDESGWELIDTEDIPLDTEEGRDTWIEILMHQDEESLERNETGWVKSLMVVNGNDMIVRFVYDDGTEEVYDLQVRRRIAVVRGASEEHN